jgi:hypothetical protein
LVEDTEIFSTPKVSDEGGEFGDRDTDWKTGIADTEPTTARSNPYSRIAEVRPSVTHTTFLYFFTFCHSVRCSSVISSPALVVLFTSDTCSFPAKLSLEFWLSMLLVISTKRRFEVERRQ